MDKTKHGVLCGGEVQELLTINDPPGQAYPLFKSLAVGQSVSTLQAAYELAEQHNLTHLWITRDARTHGEGFAQFDASAWSFLFNWKEKRPGDYERELRSVTGWRLPQGGQVQRTVIFPYNTHWTSGKPGEDGWINRATPKHLLITIHYLEKALGVPIAGSPAMVGWRLLTKLHKDWFYDVPQKLDWKEYHFSSESGRDLIWQVENKALYLAAYNEAFKAGNKLYLHKFDKNSAYLAAAASTFYGAGPLVHISEARHVNQYLKSPGVWHCVVTDVKHPIDLPKFWKTGECWLATPLVRLARASGYEVDIDEGYTFENKHLILEQWARILWEKRDSFIEDTDLWKHPICRQYAREAIKQIAVGTVGITAYSGYEEETDKRRPDIKLETVARNHEIVYHNLAKTRQLDGVTPVLVYMDALYYLSPVADGRLAFPTLAQREKLLGGYKWEGAIHVTGEVRDILAGSGPVNRKLQALNQIGWKKVS